MKKSDGKSKITILFSIISIMLSIAGIVFIILNLIFQVTGVITYTIPLGLLALVFASLTLYSGLKRYKVVLISVAAFITVSFFWAMGIGMVIEAMTGGIKIDERYEQYDKVPSPKYTVNIMEGGDIYTLIDRSEENIVYIYFGRNDCSYCEIFEEELVNYVEKNNFNSFPIIYYYNLSEMQKDESDDILKKFNINYVPFLVKIENGEVIEFLNTANEEEFRFFFGEIN